MIPRRALRPARWLCAVIAIAGTLWLVDSAVAMHAEHNISQDVKENSRLVTSPSVFVGGLSYLGAFVSGEIPLLEVNTLDVEVPELGMVSASTTARDITVTPDQLLHGNFEGARVSTFSRAISLDGVALGRLMGFTDLSIANPDNISPTGGKASEAELTATMPGQKKAATVHVTLRLVGQMFYMRPVNIVSTPEGTDEDEVRRAFSYEIDTRQLPLPSQATAVRLQGGAITFETQSRNTTLKTSQLSPLEIEGNFDSDGNQK